MRSCQPFNTDNRLNEEYDLRRDRAPCLSQGRIMRCAQNSVTPAYCIILPIDRQRPLEAAPACRPWGEQTSNVFVYAKERSTMLQSKRPGATRCRTGAFTLTAARDAGFPQKYPEFKW